MADQARAGEPPKDATELATRMVVLLGNATEIEGWGCVVALRGPQSLTLTFGGDMYDLLVVKNRG